MCTPFVPSIPSKLQQPSSRSRPPFPPILKTVHDACHLFYREAAEALATGGDLEKDQLGRVTLLGFIRWCRLRERRRLEAEARVRDPLPPWKERLAGWRQVHIAVHHVVAECRTKSMLCV